MKHTSYLTSVLAACCLAFAPAASATTESPQNQSATMTQKTQIPAGPVVDVKTTAGDIRIKLYDDTPKHRDNFLKLTVEGYYDGVLFHRVIKDFMVQAGDPESKNAAPGQQLGSGDPGYTIEAEIDYPRHFHKYGALAAARTPDAYNPERRSSGSQFYIVTGKKYTDATLSQLATRQLGMARRRHFNQLASEHRDEIKRLQTANDSTALENLRQELIRRTEADLPAPAMTPEIAEAYRTVGGTPSLDGDYTVFGEVLSGMDTVEKIQQAATDPADRPKEDIRIISIKVEK